MKNAREFFVDSFKSEKPRFVKVLQAVPDDKKAYRPHEKCSTAGDIVWLVASEWGDACEIIDHGKVDFVLKPGAREGRGLRRRVREERGRAREAPREAGRRGVGEERAVPDGRQGRLGGAGRRHALRLPVRRDPPPRPALELPAPDGREGALDLRAVGGRQRLGRRQIRFPGAVGAGLAPPGRLLPHRHALVGDRAKAFPKSRPGGPRAAPTAPRGLRPLLFARTSSCATCPRRSSRRRSRGACPASRRSSPRGSTRSSRASGSGSSSRTAPRRRPSS